MIVGNYCMHGTIRPWDRLYKRTHKYIPYIYIYTNAFNNYANARKNRVKISQGPLHISIQWNKKRANLLDRGPVQGKI